MKTFFISLIIIFCAFTKNVNANTIIYDLGSGTQTYPSDELPLYNDTSISVSASRTFIISASIDIAPLDPDFPSYIPGPWSLSKIGEGTLILSGSNTYTGGTYVDNGTLIITSANALPDGGSLTVGAGATTIFDSSISAGPVFVAYEKKTQPTTESVPEPGTIFLLLGFISTYTIAIFLRKTLSIKSASP